MGENAESNELAVVDSTVQKRLVGKRPPFTMELALQLAMAKINGEIDKMVFPQVVLEVDMAEFLAFRASDLRAFQSPIVQAFHSADWTRQYFEFAEPKGEEPAKYIFRLEALP